MSTIYSQNGQQVYDNNGQTFSATTGNLIAPAAPVTAPSAIPVSTLTAPVTPLVVTPPAIPTAPSLNTSIPSTQSIIDSYKAPTTTDTQQSEALKRITEATAAQKGQTQLTNEAETAAGLPKLATGVDELNTQLEGLNNQGTDLNNQATALQNEAQYTIPNKMQLLAEGQGITEGGLAPHTASELRMNQIKQGAIATQQVQIASRSLTIKSALYGALGKYNLAKDAADKAATAQYEQQQIHIDALNAQLKELEPTLNREDKARAALLQVQLQDRQAQIDAAKETKKSIIGWASDAMKNYPDDPAVQYAAQQALAESNKENPDLSTAFALIGKYQKDPAQAQKDLDAHLTAQAGLLLTKANIQKINDDSSLLPLQKQQLIAQIAASNASAANSRASAEETLQKVADLKAASSPVAKQAATSDLQNLANSVLNSPYLPWITGLKVPTAMFGGFLGGLVGSPDQEVINQFNQLKSALSIENRQKLKGSGAISDFEAKTLEKAASSLGTNLSNEAMKQQLKQVAGTMATASGSQALVSIINPKTGEAKALFVDREGINKAIADGLIVQYQ